MKRISRPLMIGIVLLLAAAAGYFFFIHGRAADTLSCSQRMPQPKILAFGDSLVAGYGSSIPGGFVSDISKTVGVPITNLGKNGDTTASAGDRVGQVTDAHPDIVLVLLGGNDALQQVPHAQTEENLEKIISTIQKGGSRVILLGVIGGFPDPYAAMYSRLAKAYDVTYVSNVLSGIIGHDDLMSDAVHPNEAGYQRIADPIAPVLEQECSDLAN